MRGKIKKAVWRIIFLLAVAGLAYYVFRDSAGQISQELMKISALEIAFLCICAVVYQLLDGAAITLLAKRYNSKFQYRHGIGCSYYAAFFKTITMGSGDLFACMYYYTEHGIPPEKNYGLITVFYVIQKITMTVYCVVCLFCNYSYMNGNYGQYMSYFILGIVLTIVVAVVLLFLCLSKKFHGLLVYITNKAVKKKAWKEKLSELTEKLADVRIQTRGLIKDKKLLVSLFGLNAAKLTAWYFVPVVALGIDGGVSVFAALSIISSVAALAGVLPAPAGIGSTEFVYILLFSPVIGDIRAASSVLLYRFTTFLFPAVVGGIYFLITYIKKRR